MGSDSRTLNSLQRLSLLIAVLVLGSILCCNTANAHQRQVLAEIFTNSYCPICPGWIARAETALEVFEDSEFFIIQYHTWWPGISDPWYLDNYERHVPDEVDDIQARITWMGRDQFMGVPSFFFDGYRIPYGGNRFIEDIRDLVGERLETESSILLEVEAVASHDNLRTKVWITADESFANVTLFTALCEREVEYRAPSGQTHFVGNMLDMIPTALGRVVNLPEGRRISFEFESSLDVGWRENDIDDLFIAVWIQDNEMEVLQAKKVFIEDESSSILIVNATTNVQAGAAIYNLFGEGDLPPADPWDRLDDGYITEEDLEDYSTIIWHSFNNREDIVTEDEEGALMGFLNAGGTLVMSSPYLLDDLGEGPLTQVYLAVSPDEDNVDIILVCGCVGDRHFDGCRIILGGDGGAGLPSSTPSILPRQDGQAVLNYIDGDEVAGIAAIKHETDTYKTMMLSIPIESIAGAAGTESREAFLNRLYEWINPPQSVPDDKPETSYGFSLDPSYPNPFNSVMSIPFHLEYSSSVTLSLYDVTGREVTMLMGRVRLPAGRHLQQVNTMDFGLTNGIYFLRLTANNRSQSRKVVFMK